MKNKVRAIAVYLPQFHPTPENDLNWGKGFTEWTNVTKAKPQFKEHYQPHLPADLGFYDLRLKESRLAQEELARQYDIYGFCYYHYWFNGRRVLNEPLDRKMQNPEENLPFMMCWANENWTKNWDGGNNEVLLEQKYSEEDDINHIHHLLQYFKDERYIKIEGKPFFLFYRIELFPDIRKTIETFRNEAKKAGIDGLYLGFMQSYGLDHNPQDYGFDVAVEFPPHSRINYNNIVRQLTYPERINYRLTRKLSISHRYQLIDYNDFANHFINLPETDYKNFRCVTPMWDNSARKSMRGLILTDSTPEKYQRWLEQVIKQFKCYSEEENFVFINAWNEWAEGNHLEPCRKWGSAYLAATAQALKNTEV